MYFGKMNKRTNGKYTYLQFISNLKNQIPNQKKNYFNENLNPYTSRNDSCYNVIETNKYFSQQYSLC